MGASMFDPINTLIQLVGRRQFHNGRLPKANQRKDFILQYLDPLRILISGVLKDQKYPSSATWTIIDQV